MPGSPVAPSIPSETVGHTSHGSPCPRVTVRCSPRLRGPRGGPQDAPSSPEPKGWAPRWSHAGRGCHAHGTGRRGTALHRVTLHPPCLLSAPRRRGVPAGRRQGMGLLRPRIAPAAPPSTPQALPPGMAQDGPSPKRGHRLSQTPLHAWAWIPPLLRPRSPDREPRNPSLTPGFGSRLTILTGVPGDPPGPGAPELPWSQRRESLSPAREKAAALGTPMQPFPPPPGGVSAHPAEPWATQLGFARSAAPRASADSATADPAPAGDPRHNRLPATPSCLQAGRGGRSGPLFPPTHLFSLRTRGTTRVTLKGREDGISPAQAPWPAGQPHRAAMPTPQPPCAELGTLPECSPTAWGSLPASLESRSPENLASPGVPARQPAPRVPRDQGHPGRQGRVSASVALLGAPTFPHPDFPPTFWPLGPTTQISPGRPCREGSKV